MLKQPHGKHGLIFGKGNTRSTSGGILQTTDGLIWGQIRAGERLLLKYWPRPLRQPAEDKLLCDTLCSQALWLDSGYSWEKGQALSGHRNVISFPHGFSFLILALLYFFPPFFSVLPILPNHTPRTDCFHLTLLPLSCLEKYEETMASHQPTAGTSVF